MNEKYFLPLSVVVAGLIIGGAVLWNGSRPSDGAVGAGGTPPVVNIENVDMAGDPYIGRADAPLTMAYWADYRCSYCQKFEVETFPLLIENYVNIGKLRIVFMDFAFLSEESLTAALYGRAVWKLYPNQYVAWREAVFSAQASRPGFGNAASIDALNATIPGLDAARIKADVEANRAAHTAAADADKVEGQKQGVNATPSFIVADQLIAGAYPYATFEATLNTLLQ